MAGHLTIGDARPGHGPDRHPQLDRRRGDGVGLPGHRQPRLAQVVGGLPEPARTSAAGEGPAGAAGGARSASEGAEPTRRRLQSQSRSPVIIDPMRLMLSRRATGLVFALAACVARASIPADVPAAVPPPKLDYKITTLANGLTVILSEDHSTPIVHVELWYHVGIEGREARPHRLRAPVRAHDVQGLEERRAGGARLVHRQRRRPGQRRDARRHHGLLADGAGAVSAADAVARGRPDGDAAHRRGHVQARARGREGRAADARREPALRPVAGVALRRRVHGAPVQASRHRQHEGPRGGLDRRRARVLSHLLRADQRDADHRRRLRRRPGRATGRAVSTARSRSRRRPCRATSRRSRR